MYVPEGTSPKFRRAQTFRSGVFGKQSGVMSLDRSGDFSEFCCDEKDSLDTNERVGL